MSEISEPTPLDVLSQLMDAFRLRGSVSAQLAVRSPWGYAFPGSRDLGLLVVMRGRVARWLEPTVRLLALESAAPLTGRSMVLNRLAEVVFIHLLRAWLDSQSPRCGGLLRAVTDPQLTGAFAAFHAEPGGSWTLET